MSEKKLWMTPQVVVLARGTPEEQVLDTCKDGWGYPGKNPYGQYNASWCGKDTSQCSGSACCSCDCQNST